MAAPKYTPEQLTRLRAKGFTHRHAKTGQLIPLNDAEDVTAAIQTERSAKPGAEDYELRRKLVRHAASRGVARRLPAEWTNPDGLHTSKGAVIGPLAKASTREQWDLDRVAREIRNAVNRVTKAAGCTWHDLEIDVETPPERTERLAKAAEADRLARVTSDPVTAAHYRRQAREIREEHRSSTERHAEAAEYERKASRVTDPVLASGYRQLAREARGKAGTS